MLPVRRMCSLCENVFRFCDEMEWDESSHLVNKTGMHGQHDRPAQV